MFNYDNIGLDQNLRSTNSPLLKIQTVDSYDFSNRYSIEATRLRASRLQIHDFIKNSQVGTASGGPFSSGDVIEISTSLTSDNLFSQSRILGAPQLSIYQGTAAVGSLQIWPDSGVGIGTDNYVYLGAGMDYGPSDGKNLFFVVEFKINTGGTIALFAVSQWRYIAESEGDASNS